MRALLHTEFAALLTRAGVSQAAFARLSGYTPRQVNNWCRGRAAVRRAVTRLAHAYHPDKGGTQPQMTRINAAYEQARANLEISSPARKRPPPPRPPSPSPKR